MNVYVASSWRNERQNIVVSVLKQKGFNVYDFKNPAKDNKGFHWSEIDGGWKSWSVSQYLQALDHPLAIQGFHNDWDAMEWADVCVLVLPSGRSSHIEAGWFVGWGKPLIVLHDPVHPIEPELMLKMADLHCHHTRQIVDFLRFNEKSIQKDCR